MFKRRVLLLSLLLGILIWVIDAVLDYVVFYRGTGSLLDLLLLDVPSHDLFIRILIVILLICAGFLFIWFAERTRDKLLAREQWFSTTLQSIGDAVITADINGKVTFMNNVAEHLTGWKSDTAKGRPVSQVFRVVREGTDDPVEEPVEKVLSEGGVVGLANHTELIALDGTRYAIEDSGAPIRQAGEIIGVVLVFHDVTEKRKVQRSIEDNEQQLATLLNNLPGMAYRYKLNDILVMDYVNANSYELTGYHPAEFLTERIVRYEDLISDKDLERVKETLKVAIETGNSFEITYRLVTSEGNEKWVLDSGEPVYSDKEDLQHIEGFITDITEQRHVYERYRALFQSLQDAIIVTNDRREIIDCNEAFLNLFGYEYDEIYGTTTSVIYASESIYTEIGRHVEDFSKDEYFSTETLCERKDKSQFRAELFVGYLHDYLGNRMGNVAVIRDLTRQEIMEQELIHAQKMEALGQMAGGIAHDFNNVIASVSGAVQMLELKLQDDSLKKYLDIIKSSVERGNSVTSRMLTFTKSEKPKTRPISLIEFIQEIRTIAEHTLPKNVNIRTAKYHGHDYVSADPNQLQQVLISLCINAADSMPQGGNIELGIRRAYRQEQQQHAADPGREYLCLVISDTGAGMEKDIQEHIFEPFFTTKERTKGTGLGLSVAYTIINRHDGWIHVDSQKGVGSTFVIGLPATEPEDLIERKDIEPEQLPPAGNGELILVVEDEMALQNLVVEILESHGYRAQVANNSLQALDLFSENPDKFDLILTDLGLPQMSGEELIEHIRGMNPRIPIIAATGYVNEERNADVLNRGVTALIQKPFSLQHLLETLHKLFYQ